MARGRASQRSYSQLWLQQASFSIGDFITDLLFRMEYEDNGPESFGQVPIIVVADSMGGLVFKTAFVQGLLNDEFHDITSHVKASLFLATSHRGTHLAKTLNRILIGSVFGYSPKGFVTELTRGSPTIDELNESFRHHASRLQILSFCETIATSVGPVQFMIIEKSSSVMGYSNETRQPPNASHHTVSKFTGAEDPNCASVALRSAMASITSPEAQDKVAEDELRLVKELLGIAGPPRDDLIASRALRKDGTCESILATDHLNLKSWTTSGDHPLWAHAPPGSGKSTVAAYVVDHLLASSVCAFYFFKHGNMQGRSSASMLRSIPLQMAMCIPGFRQQVAALVRSGMAIQEDDGITVWRIIFLIILATI
ncbi:uncharacterized protein E0L32_004936 [Thyridium curvatum]|uniref:Nephrocystin 3-like N-terminal domain-containing protein n=1 Tax=Thyridium curvatum TaxID=1093900 RepID=A0A507B4Z8_9PEZI|nr:uncharacterized protein E0L32_004936 [Thyridium curvatum]TPX14827.1 hypothetical protein E0L32_004936 [Thyridium curvatum]